MPWFRIDDSAHSHPKIVTAGNAAFGLWVRCGSWSSSHLTDGFVPTNVLLMFGSANTAAKLVEVGLLEIDPHKRGWWIHDYVGTNPSRAELEQERERQSKGGRKGAGRRWTPASPVTDGDDSVRLRVAEPMGDPIGLPIDDPMAHPTVSRDAPYPSPLEPPLPPADAGGRCTHGHTRCRRCQHNVRPARPGPPPTPIPAQYEPPDVSGCVPAPPEWREAKQRIARNG